MLYIYFFIFIGLVLFSLKTYKKNLFLSLWMIIIVQEIVLALFATAIVQKYVDYRIVLENSYLLNALCTTAIPCSLYLFKRRSDKKHDLFFTHKSLPILTIISFFFAIPFFFSVAKLIALHGSFVIIPFTDLRSEIGSSFSGIDYVFLRFGLLLCSLFAVQYALTRDKFKLLFILFVVYSMSLYGGRFLPFFGILISFMIIRFQFFKNLNGSRIVLGLVVFQIISILMANLRYFYSNKGSLSEILRLDYILATSYWQLGGAWIDYSRVADSLNKKLLTDGFLPTLIQGFIPGALRKFFGEEFFEKSISFGGTIAKSIGIYHTGIRVNFTNEIFFSFGFLGVLTYSIIIGVIIIWIERISSYPLQILIFTQLVSVHILGVNTVGTATIFVSICWFIYRLR